MAAGCTTLPFDVDRATIEEHICSSRPFVIRGATRTWPQRDWSDARWLEETIGSETKVTVRENVPGERGEWLGLPAELCFGDFVRQWTEPEVEDYSTAQGSTRLPRFYLASLPISRNFPQLSQNIVIPPFAAEQGPKYGNFWMGNAGQVTPLHYDYSSGEPGMDGFHVLLAGSKVFRLYDPVVNLGCIPRKREWWRWHQADIDPDAPDLAAHPRFASARCVEIELGPGDLLFIPKLWWHHVYTLRRAVAVNFWFQHLGSEELKLDRHWAVVEEHLVAAAQMTLAPSKWPGVLRYHGLGDVSDAAAELLMAAPALFLRAPTFVDHVGNVANSSFFEGDTKRRIGLELRRRARALLDAMLPPKSATRDEILALPVFAKGVE
eukprot:Amastigsp_a683668_23.p1 type:complete len:379 gc:universal Amastigsp_a683668_23:1167-31(-)